MVAMQVRNEDVFDLLRLEVVALQLELSGFTAVYQVTMPLYIDELRGMVSAVGRCS